MRRSVVFAFALAAGLLLNLAVPPFQNPDEPVHFGAVLRAARGEGRNLATEKEIIRFMDRSNWWRFIGLGRPAELPEKLGRIRYLLNGGGSEDSYSGIGGLLVYHRLASRVLRLAGITDLEASYYFLRLFSFVLFLIALAFLGAGFDRLSRSGDRSFVWALPLVLLVPQFLVVSISVTPDMFCVALGAAFFCATIAILEGQPSPGHFVLAVLTVAAGVLTDKSVFVLLPLALLLAAFALPWRKARSLLALAPLLAVAAAGLVAGLFLLFRPQVENSLRILKWSFGNKAGAFGAMFAWGEFNRRFITLFTDSFFLKFGGMAFGAEKALVAAWRGLAAVAGAGVALFFAGLPFSPPGRRPRPGAFQVKAVVFSLVAFGAQVFGVRVAASPANIYAQGRYLFPVMGFVAILFLVGLRTIGDLIPAIGLKIGGREGTRSASPETGSRSEFPLLKLLAIAGLFVLTIVVWRYIVPVFHMTIASPHPGF